MHRACARLDGKRYQWLNAEESEGIWAASQFRPRIFASHVARTHGISYRKARQSVRLAHQLRDDIPEFGRALRSGNIGPDHVHALASTALTSPTRIAALSEHISTGDDPDSGNPDSMNSPGLDDETAGEYLTVEQYLLGQAQQLRPDQVRYLGRHFARVADPDADERGYQQAKEREYVELVRTLDGWHLSGFLTEENGRLLRTALDAVQVPPSEADMRSGQQRRAQALADIAHVLLDRGLLGTNASVRPHVGVLINPTEMERLVQRAEMTESPPAPTGGQQWRRLLQNSPPTWADGTGPVPESVLRRLASCGDVYRILFSTESEVLNHGRAHRTFTAAQRRALVARDQGCTWPGCTAPPSVCESHHARVHWADGGGTDVANGALLCYHHHDVVDDRGVTMTRTGGVWIFTRSDGSVINTDRLPAYERNGLPVGVG
ncbi:MAG TPA: DUF222 domain-containing protein [Ruania sp.]|nr:DUF222 domain-containing protein [Ruania sp.]